MSYPPNPGYPYPNAQQPSGLGFGNLYQQPAAAPYPGAGAPYPASTAAPYPTSTAAPYPTSTAAPYGQPAPAPYGQPASGPYPAGPSGTYPMPGGQPAPAGGMPNPYNPGYPAGPSFQSVAMATTAFRPPFQQQPYGAAPSPYPAPSSQGWGQAPIMQPLQQPTPPSTGGSLARHNTLPPQHVKTQGTVKPFPSFSAQQDAEVLRKAMKGFGCDEKAVAHILGTRSNTQRQQIKLEYKTIFGRDLIKDLKSELSGCSEDLATALMMPSDEYDAYLLRKAMKGLGTDEDTLIEILCTRTNKQIQEAANAFKKLYDRNLEKDVHSETSGHFRRLLVSLCQGYRDEAQVLDLAKAREDANKLYQAGEARWGTDESQFNSILVQRSYAQLRATFEEYSKLCKYSIEASIERELSGDLKRGMSTIVKCVKNTPSYFAERLHYSMKGLGTDDDMLIRIVVSRSEIDMVEIKHMFSKMYGKTLGRYITDDTSGNYKRMLLELIGGVS